MMEAWLSSSETDADPAVAEGGQDAEVGGEAGGEDDGPVGALPGGQGHFELLVAGSAPGDQAAAPAPAPQRSRARWAAATTAGWAESRDSRWRRRRPPSAVLGEDPSGPWASKVRGWRQRASARRRSLAAWTSDDQSLTGCPRRPRRPGLVGHLGSRPPPESATMRSISAAVDGRGA